jgi:hypothetical protein
MNRYRNWAACLFITCYLGSLSWGIVAHSMKIGLCGNPLNYLVVWDMFCGWQAYDDRTHVIAEGQSGQYYELSEPWGDFRPFGHVPRIHYDVTNQLLPRHITNILEHTTHEQIDRVYVAQEIWPKQYNLPARLWSQYYVEPPDRISYYHLRAVLTDKGQLVTAYPDWFTEQALNSIADNPRLRHEMNQARSTYSTLFDPSYANQLTSASGMSGAASGMSLNTN